MTTTYESILFLQGEQADDMLDAFEDYSGEEFLSIVMETADPYGDACFPQDTVKPWGEADDRYTMVYDSEKYVVSINWGVPYIGITRVINL